MPSKPAPKETGPHDKAASKSSAAAAARADKASPKPAQDGPPSAPRGHTISDVLAAVSAPSVKAMFRAAAADSTKVPSDRPAIGKWARRARIGLLFALCSAVAAAGWVRY